MSLKIGEKAPDFSLQSTSGKVFQLSSDMSHKPCIVYFYPKSFTGVCNAEACGFRDEFEQFKNLDIPIIGISKDNLETQLKFKSTFQLPFDILADTDGSVAKKYKATMPIIQMMRRVTYLLDENHYIQYVYEDLFQGKKHTQEMLKFLKK
jgi:peroxiredoxin Q/BCP